MARNKKNMIQIDWQEILKKWWFSILLLPFIGYHIHQANLTLNYNIFFSISYSFPFPVNVEKFLMRNLLLIIHEAGHTFFSVFGNRIITILGGSLNEILFPSIILAYTLFNKLVKATQFAFYMIGSGWFSIAFYAADASQRQLPLIGNLGPEAHDWHNLLRHWNMLELDGLFGVVFVCIGIVCYLIAVSVPLWFKKTERVRLDLNL
ncbi:MAG: hypothetical protein JJU13_06160 [Balneolaceae bacterium]|nr:hypothetical protein [Balneolaceae bacterium]